MQSETLIGEIEKFLEAQNLSATRFGVLVAGDTKFVKTLREGRLPRVETVKRVRDWMKKSRKR